MSPDGTHVPASRSSASLPPDARPRLLVANDRRPTDSHVGEDIEVVGAHCRELRDDGAVVSRLEPVEHVGRDRVLFARAKLDLVPDGERVFAGTRRSTRGVRSRRPLDIEIDDTAAASKGLFLARKPVVRRMPVLRARLTRKEHELLGTHPLRVHVHHELEADHVELRETEVGDLDVVALDRSQDDSGIRQNRGRTFPRRTQLRSRQHG